MERIDDEIKLPEPPHTGVAGLKLYYEMIDREFRRMNIKEDYEKYANGKARFSAENDTEI